MALLALLGILVPLGCVDDRTWIDEVTVIFEGSANSLVALSVQVQEGNLTDNDPYVIDSDTGVLLGEVYGSGEHQLELVSTTESQRRHILFVVWADDPASGTFGEPDCTEDGTRLMPEFNLGEMKFVFPSQEYPLSWCGALIGPFDVEI